MKGMEMFTKGKNMGEKPVGDVDSGGQGSRADASGVGQSPFPTIGAQDGHSILALNAQGQERGGRSLDIAPMLGVIARLALPDKMSG